VLEKQRALEAERVAQLQAETAAMEAEASAIMEGTENQERADSPSPSERLKLVPSTLQPEPEPVLPPSPPPSSPSSLPPSPPPPLPHLLTSSPPRQRYGNEGSRTLSIATGFLPTSTGCSYEPAGSAGSVLSGRARQEYDAIRARTIDRSPRSPVAYASAPYFGLRSSERTVLSSPSPAGSAQQQQQSTQSHQDTTCTHSTGAHYHQAHQCHTPSAARWRQQCDVPRVCHVDN
jgi:hypothetical protein